MAQRLVNQSELSRIAGVSRMAISKAVRGVLSGALQGNKLDLDHPSVVKYLDGKQQEKAEAKKPTKKPAAKKTAPAPAPKKAQKVIVPKAPPGSTDFEEMTLKEIIGKFGTSYQFKDYLASWKTLADIRLKELQLKERNGQLIERDFVQSHVFALLDGMHKRLLMDTPKTIAAQVIAMTKSGANETEISRTVHDLISAQIISVQKKVRKNLGSS